MPRPPMGIPPPSPPPPPPDPIAPQLGRLALNRAYAGHAAYTQYTRQRDANRPSAPEHVQMLNNLVAERADCNQRSVSLNLPHDARPSEGDYQPPSAANCYRKLHAHVKTIMQTPSEVCFNCAMQMYPASENKHRLDVNATPVRTHADCRGYRVARHFIDRLVDRANEGLQDGHDAATLDDFCRCKPTPDGQHIEVFSCAHCKKEATQLSCHRTISSTASLPMARTPLSHGRRGVPGRR